MLAQALNSRNFNLRRWRHIYAAEKPDVAARNRRHESAIGLPQHLHIELMYGVGENSGCGVSASPAVRFFAVGSAVDGAGPATHRLRASSANEFPVCARCGPRHAA